jgi:hypothetical protein
MPVIDRRGQPLPPDHPFAQPTIVIGGRRPAPREKSTSGAESIPPKTPDATGGAIEGGNSKS